MNAENTEENYFNNLELSLKNTQTKRNELSEKLNEIVKNIDFNFHDKLAVNQSKIGVINSYTNLLNDIDSQSFNLEKIKLSKKNNDNEAKYGELIVTCLNKITKENISKQSSELNEDKLEEIFNTIEVNEGELEV